MLPVDAIRDALLTALARGPVVLSSPTGSGKSTQVPRWVPRPVLIVEPRRVACRGLAQWVAELEGTGLGEGVGYIVRDDHRAGSELCFVTPGVALRMDHSAYATIILDEFHERTLDVDLLFALLARHPRLVVMSATLEGDRIAAHLGGQHLHVDVRSWPVTTQHLPGGTALPDLRGLDERLDNAVGQALTQTEGDLLVFLPGKAEIHRALQRLAHHDAELLALHGGLSLAEQSRVFKPGPRRRILCATNVAETSLTVPRISAVIDSGLVRQTRYHRGRGYLTLLPIAADSATQRAGRAGRLGPGRCWRLWSASAPLASHTPPEIHRESLVPLVLASAANGHPDLDLPWLDPPRDYALADARSDLRELGALDDDGLSQRGRQIWGLPLDAHLGRLLVERTAPDTVDLVAALSAGHRLRHDPDQECDAVALIQAARQLPELKRLARRLRRAFDVHGEPEVDSHALALALLRAWPRCAFVARRRKRRLAWNNGGTEASLSEHSHVDPERNELIAALDLRAMGKRARDKTLIITAAMPIRQAWMLAAGLGRDRVGQARVRRGRLLARVERVYARKVLEVREEVPSGALAREAIQQLVLAGQLLDGPGLRRALELHALHARLQRLPPPPPIEEWIAQRLEDLGVQHGDDLALIEPADLRPPALEPEAREQLDRHYPRELRTGDAVYRVHYELARKTVRLERIRGQRSAMPPLSFLPAWPGWRIEVQHRNAVRVLRG